MKNGRVPQYIIVLYISLIIQKKLMLFLVHPPLINSISNFFGSKFMKINQITSIKKKQRNKNSVSPDSNEEKKNVKFENNYYDTKEKIE